MTELHLVFSNAPCYVQCATLGGSGSVARRSEPPNRKAVSVNGFVLGGGSRIASLYLESRLFAPYLASLPLQGGREGVALSALNTRGRLPTP